MNWELTRPEADDEIERIVNFIKSSLEGKPVVLGLSGGIDSEVAARLCVRALDAESIKLILILHRDANKRHIDNARQLAKELKMPLSEIDFRKMPGGFLKALSNGDPGEGFDPKNRIDIGRVKYLLRTMVFGIYHDNGYLKIRTGNRTEEELGFSMQIGGPQWPVCPIAHLYKTEVYSIAAALGARKETMDMPPSAGYWKGEEDLKDWSYWLYNGGSLGRFKAYSGDDYKEIKNIRANLSHKKIDLCLLGLSRGLDDADISKVSGLDIENVGRFRFLLSTIQKNRPKEKRLDNRL